MNSNPGYSGQFETTSHSYTEPEYPLPVRRIRLQDPSSGRITPIDKESIRSRRSLSPWSKSLRKRFFDMACVVCSFPITIPMFLMTGLAVRLSSHGPVLFRQERMGRNGKTFTILKFRTMPVRRDTSNRPDVTTSMNQSFTPVGPFLRRWKLDELPQLINVLRGEMSLVGPRPKLPNHQMSRLNCRPGITGRATIVFAREELVLSPVPSSQLDSVYHKVVLPLKQRLDEEYMASATFSSDLKLIFDSMLRRWEDLELRHLLQFDPEFARQMKKPVPKPATGPVMLPQQQPALRSELQAD